MISTTHAISCEEVMAFLDGEFSAEKRDAIASHMATCPECKTQAEAFQSGTETLLSWKIDPLRPEISKKILAASAEGNPAIHSNFLSSIPFWTRQQWILRFFAPVSAVFLLFVLISSSTSYKRSVAPGESVLTRVSKLSGAPAADTRKGLAFNANEAWSAPAEPDSKFSSYSFSKSTPQPPVTQVTHPSSPTIGPMIARTVSLSIVAKDFDASRTILDSILTRNKGYSSTLIVNTQQGEARSLQASLRIPAPQLASTLIELKALGHVESESQKGDEVTREHADLIARLKNSRETEQRMQAILVQRTGKISDVLEVEQEIARVRGEIEQMEAQQKTLEHRVDFATIDLQLSEEYKAQLGSSSISVPRQLRNAIVTGFTIAFESFVGVLLFLASSVPSLLLWLAILFLPARLLWKRYRRFQQSAVSA